jgi:phosphoribosylanthranilate isomerase
MIDMWVKICGLRTNEAVETAVAQQADAVGFVLTASPRQVAPELARSLVCLAAGKVLTVGVFRGESVAGIEALAEAAGVDAVQVHGEYSVADLGRLRAGRRPFIRALPIDHLGIAGQSAPADLLLIDSPVPGSGQAWAWDQAARPRDSRWIMAGGLNAGNVVEAVRATGAGGVDVSSGVERERGIKDLELVAEFIRVARSIETPEDLRPGNLFLRRAAGGAARR